MIRSLAATLIALVIMGALAVPVRADSTPDSGTLMSTGTITPTGTLGVFDVNTTGSGTDLLSGAFTTTSMSIVTFTSPTTDIFSGSFVTVFSQGTTFGTFTGSGTATGADTSSITEDVVTTGGTGIFAGVTGEVTLTGTDTQTGPTTTSFTGSYTAPEPSSLALMLAGIGLLPLMRKRLARGRVATR
jgi:hypothetical protein